MYSSKVALNYAQNFISSIKDTKKYNEEIKSLDSLQKIAFAHQDFFHAITSPIVPLAEKKAILDEIAEKLKLSSIVRNFVVALLENSRIQILEQIVQICYEIARQKSGICTIEVIFAKDPSEKSFKVVELFLKNNMEGELLIQHKVDASITGGVIIKYDNHMIDASVSGGLRHIASKLSN